MNFEIENHPLYLGGCYLCAAENFIPLHGRLEILAFALFSERKLFSSGLRFSESLKEQIM